MLPGQDCAPLHRLRPLPTAGRPLARRPPRDETARRARGDGKVPLAMLAAAYLAKLRERKPRAEGYWGGVPGNLPESEIVAPALPMLSRTVHCGGDTLPSERVSRTPIVLV